MTCSIGEPVDMSWAPIEAGIIGAMETLTLILALVAIILSILAIGQSLLRGRGEEEEATEDVEALLSEQAKRQESSLRDEFERARETGEKSDARLREEMSKRLDSVSETLMKTMVLEPLCDRI